MTLAGLPTDTLYDVATAALTAVTSQWPSSAVDLPDRQHVNNGTVLWDCEELVVSIDRLAATQADPAVEEYTSLFHAPRFAVLSVWLIRQVPDVDAQGQEIIIPSAKKVDDSARIAFADAVLVWNCMMAAQDAGTLGPCKTLAFQDWTPAGPEGGFGGGVTRARVTLL